tara:strand:+ start:789 stop:1010 length:222 start_codon:yes stop_codon:yes gene_type:complete
MTSRGLKEADFTEIAKFLDRCCKIALDVQKHHGKKIVDFKKGLDGNKAIEQLRADVHAFTAKFPIPGDYVQPQ